MLRIVQSRLTNKALILLTALCLMLSACAHTQAKYGEAAASEPGAAGILSTLFDAKPELLSGFSYYGDAAYARDWDGSLIPELGLEAEEFGCAKNLLGSAYFASESRAIFALATGLENFKLAEDSGEDLTAESVVDNGAYIGFCLAVSGWYPYLYVFENGDVYVDRSRDGSPPRRYKATDPAQYADLKQAVEEARTILDALPLDYHLSVSAAPQEFTPDSTAVRLTIENKSAKPVEFPNPFMIERETDGVWTALSAQKSAPQDTQLRSIEPHGHINYSVDLMRIPNGREAGRYRVSNTFFSQDESMELALLYEINADADAESHPFPPESSEENRLYYLKYMSTWGFYNPFKESYSDGGFIEDLHPYLLYLSCVYQEGKSQEYSEKYGNDIPAEIVDGIIARHFPVTVEEFRASLPIKSGDAAEYYDPESDTYHFEGGYGGASAQGVVTHAEHDRNLLRLTCAWYGSDDRYEFTHTVTIRLGDGSNDFFYIENNVHPN